jgi:hypothetical protein
MVLIMINPEYEKEIIIGAPFTARELREMFSGCSCMKLLSEQGVDICTYSDSAGINYFFHGDFGVYWLFRVTKPTVPKPEVGVDEALRELRIKYLL